MNQELLNQAGLILTLFGCLYVVISTIQNVFLNILKDLYVFIESNDEIIQANCKNKKIKSKSKNAFRFMKIINTCWHNSLIIPALYFTYEICKIVNLLKENIGSKCIINYNIIYWGFYFYLGSFCVIGLLFFWARYNSKEALDLYSGEEAKADVEK